MDQSSVKEDKEYDIFRMLVSDDISYANNRRSYINPEMKIKDEEGAKCSWINDPNFKVYEDDEDDMEEIVIENLKGIWMGLVSYFIIFSIIFHYFSCYFSTL
jgi:hypothetical protein